MHTSHKVISPGQRSIQSASNLLVSNCVFVWFLDITGSVELAGISDNVANSFQWWLENSVSLAGRCGNKTSLRLVSIACADIVPKS